MPFTLGMNSGVYVLAPLISIRANVSIVLTQRVPFALINPRRIETRNFY